MSNIEKGTIKEAQLFHSCPPPVTGKAVPTPMGSMNYCVLRNLIEEMGVLQRNKGAEIGVFQGTTSLHLLKSFPNLVLYSVDPFEDYSEYEPERNQSQMQASEQMTRERLAPFGERSVLMKEYSAEAAKKIAPGELDFVFIDALHTYEAVTEDLTCWYNTVRPGGLIAGHDYSWPGVREALEDFLSKHQKAAFYTPSTSDVWFFFR